MKFIVPSLLSLIAGLLGLIAFQLHGLRPSAWPAVEVQGAVTIAASCPLEVRATSPVQVETGGMMVDGKWIESSPLRVKVER